MTLDKTRVYIFGVEFSWSQLISFFGVAGMCFLTWFATTEQVRANTAYIQQIPISRIVRIEEQSKYSDKSMEQIQKDIAAIKEILYQMAADRGDKND